MKVLAPALVLFWAWLLSAAAPAHEVRPGYLQITEMADHGYEVLWKRPLVGDSAVHLVPHLSGGWLDKNPGTIELTSSFAIETWKFAPDQFTIDGRTVSIEGLENTITDALMIVRRADGTEWQTILTPAHPEVVLRGGSPSQGGMWAFLSMGVVHILTGVDHLLFVLGLLLIVADRRMLLKTVTAFTAAHSITLAIATMGFARVPAPFVNAAIALSILFLGPEIVRRFRGGTSFTIAHPWVAAFAFGLLHGFGFASGLTTIGLPRHQIATALLFFNVGVEIGQLGFVALILWLEHAFRVLMIRWPRALRLFPAYLVGTLGAMWTLERVLLLFERGP